MDSMIFDLDGTLWDSTDSVADAWNEAISAHLHQSPQVTPKILKSLFGQTMDAIAADLFPTETVARQQAIMDSCCEKEHEVLLKKGATLYPNLEETLKFLSAKHPLFIVSNCQAGYIEIFLQITGFGIYFTDHLCPGDTGNPKAANISEIIKRNGLNDPIYIGDTIGDQRACKEAGIPFVYASYGFGNVDNPDYSITNLKDLITLFHA